MEKPENEQPVLETEFWQANLGFNQYNLGRCYVNLKRNCSSLSELTEKEMLDLLIVIKKLETSIKKAFNATMFNWTYLMNNSYKLKFPNPHVHFHLIPRYKEKVEFEKVIFEDKEFASNYAREGRLELSEETRQKIIEKIQENF